MKNVESSSSLPPFSFQLSEPIKIGKERGSSRGRGEKEWWKKKKGGRMALTPSWLFESTMIERKKRVRGGRGEERNGRRNWILMRWVEIHCGNSGYLPWVVRGNSSTCSVAGLESQWERVRKASGLNLVCLWMWSNGKRKTILSLWAVYWEWNEKRGGGNNLGA